MTREVHQEAQQLLALGDAISDAERKWLRAHLAECDACRDYAESTRRVVAALRSIPIAADLRLVRAAQMQVRFHAARLRETRERMWLVGVVCVSVGISTAFSAPFLWRLFAWLGTWAGVSATVWEASFVFFWIAPALITSLILLGRGTHLAGSHSRSQHWK